MITTTCFAGEWSVQAACLGISFLSLIRIYIYIYSSFLSFFLSFSWSLLNVTSIMRRIFYIVMIMM